MSETISVSNSDTDIFKVVLKTVKFTLVSYVVSVILIAALAVLLVYTDMSEAVSAPAVKGITLFGAFLSAFLTAKTANAKGWLCGMFAGAFNIFALQLIGTAAFGAPLFVSSNFIMVALGAVCGMTGGIIGVNFGN